MIAESRASAETAGYRDLWRSAPPALARRHGIAHLEVGGGVCLGCASLSGHPIFNHAIGLGLRAPADDARLDEVDAFFGRLGAAYTVAVDTAAPGLAEALVQRGFAERGPPWMTFRRDPGSTTGVATAAGLDIDDAGPSRATAFGSIVATAFGLPPDFATWIAALVGRPGWTCLLALDRGEPVGAAALFADGDRGWFSLGATLPEHRGRGSQGALFAERLRRARRLGLRSLVTETGAPVRDESPGPSYRNILRFGFAEEALRPNLGPPAAA